MAKANRKKSFLSALKILATRINGINVNAITGIMRAVINANTMQHKSKYLNSNLIFE